MDPEDPMGDRARRGIRTVVALSLLPLAATARDGGEEARIVEVGALRLAIPRHWVGLGPRARMRLTEFRLGKARPAGEAVRFLAEIPMQPGAVWGPRAELAVFHFGRGGAGDDESVIRRWIAQFALKRPGVDVDRRVRIRDGRRGGQPYTLVDASGTYYHDVGPAFRVEVELVPRVRMLAAILATPEGPYYVKLTGPAPIVAAAEPAFRTAVGARVSGETLREPGALVRVRLRKNGKPHVDRGIRVSLDGRRAAWSGDGVVFERVPPGRHVIAVTRLEGYAPIPPREIEVDSGATLELAFVLTPAPAGD